MESVQVGSVCRCQKGIIAIVTGLPRFGSSVTRRSFVGITAEGKRWQSVRPELVAKTWGEYMQQQCDSAYECGQHDPYTGE